MSRKQCVSGQEKYGCSDEGHGRKNILQYTREEMLKMKDAPPSLVRPHYLSAEFDKYDLSFGASSNDVFSTVNLCPLLQKMRISVDCRILQA